MPVLDVNSEGVSFAMSFICGLSTIATLIDPPLEPVPEAGDPLDVEELSEPPQPAITAPTTAITAPTDPVRHVPLMDLLLLGRRGRSSSAVGRLITLVCVGCQGQSGDFRRWSKCWRFRCPLFILARVVVWPSPISLSQAHLDEIALGGIGVPAYDRARLQPGIVHIGV